MISLDSLAILGSGHDHYPILPIFNGGSVIDTALTLGDRLSDVKAVNRLAG
jgi:hypothetical protein